MSSTGVLIYFIHHVSSSIQVENLVAHVGRELKETIDRLFPCEVGEGSQASTPQKRTENPPPQPEGDGHQLLARESNYLQSVDTEVLMRLASEHNLIIKLPHRPGEFVLEGNALAQVSSAPGIERKRKLMSGDRQVAPVIAQIEAAFVLGPYRTATQDPEYSVQQLVEIAARALSPGVNEPFTAITCLDWLSAALARLAGRPIPDYERRDGRGQIRVVTTRVTFAGMTDTAFNVIRQYGCSNPAVAIRLLEVIHEIAPHAQREEDREVLLRHAQLIKEDSDQKIGNKRDIEDVEERYRKALNALLPASVSD